MDNTTQHVADARAALLKRVKGTDDMNVLDLAFAELVEPLPLSTDVKAALWLLGWSEMPAHRQRSEAEATLALLAAN